MMKEGKIYLVGAGPGDIGLFTLKGKHLLVQADVVVYDALVSPEILALIPDSARRIDVGKRAGSHPVPQGEINRILLQEAMAGKLVVRLKGGDPFLFGRGGEELELLSEYNIPFEIVPGVTSAISVPAYAGIPVSHRSLSSSVHIVAGHTKHVPEAQIDYEALVRLGGTLIFLMGVGALEEICKGLLRAGMPAETPAAIIERGTTAAQRTVVSTVKALPEHAREAGIGTPAVIAVGRVCALAEEFSWMEKRPLGGRTVLVTRPRDRAGRFSQLLRDYGAQVIELPCIETMPLEPNPELDEAFSRLREYSWLVFTSSAGVRLFFDALRGRGKDVRALGGIKLAAIGSATAAELEMRGLIPDLVPEIYSGEELGKALVREVRPDERVLLARAKEGSAGLPKTLKAAAVAYDDLAVYETRYTWPNADVAARMLDAGEVDYVAFTSASTVRGFVNTLGRQDNLKFTAVCIGKATEAAAKESGMRTAIAKEATIESMVERMIELGKGEL
jgi:uroporphyrinogen III methyltransferase/synthase